MMHKLLLNGVRRSRPGVLAVALAAVAGAGIHPIDTRDGPPGAGAPRSSALRNVDYNGRFTFTRIRYGYGGGELRGFRRGGAAWAHDYPQADLNMQRILSELTTVAANLDDSNVFDLDDPELFRHPVAYMSEPGFWSMTDEQASALRDYLLRGGFLIFDDFEARQWINFEAQLRRALPEYDIVELETSHPVFQSFFTFDSIDVPHPLVNVEPRYYAVFENNDPSGRVMVLVNHNSDLAEYWEYSGTGYFPVDPTNDAWKLGVNYIIYALTH